MGRERVGLGFGEHVQVIMVRHWDLLGKKRIKGGGKWQQEEKGGKKEGEEGQRWERREGRGGKRGGG